MVKAKKMFDYSKNENKQHLSNICGPKKYQISNFLGQGAW